MDAISTIRAGKAVLGIEFGSTRIKAVLTDGDFKPIAQGSHEWENRLVDGLWTYSEDDIWTGLQDCYASLRQNVQQRYGCPLEKLSAIGISAMMHGYLPFDGDGKMLVPFRTWRNTNTAAAAKELSALFDFNIPLRWSISHLYQAILNGEAHVEDIAFLTTLAGYVHWKLTGQKVLGVGDASGMLPVDSQSCTYDAAMVDKFNALISPEGFRWKLQDILPRPLTAGAPAGELTTEGAALLDVSGQLSAGIPLCPPEGDAGTGMVATNAVRPRTGNVSAGTSSFSMIVLERPLSKPHETIDMVTTPHGKPVAMVHCNNCTSDLNAWAGLFKEFQALMGGSIGNGAQAAETVADTSAIFTALFEAAGKGDPDCGGLVSFNYVSGEPVTGFTEGRPLFFRSASDKFNLSNFLRSILYSSVAVLKIGNDILFKEEKVQVDRITGHGGLFKSTDVGQRILSAALDSPISVMETAGEGGAWGIALLAAYLTEAQSEASLHSEAHNGMSLPDFLDKKVFKGDTGRCLNPEPKQVEGFAKWMEKYISALKVEKAAVEC